MKKKTRLIIFLSGFMKRFGILLNTSNITKIIFICLLVVLISYLNIKSVYAIEIIKAEFVDSKNFPILERHGYSYGIIVSLESKTYDIRDTSGKEIVPVNFLVSKDDGSENIVIAIKYNRFTPPKEDPKKIDYFLMGAFAPELNYILTVNWQDETKSTKLFSSKEVQKVLSTDEKISSWISNKFDVDFAFRPITNQTNVFASDIHLRMELLKTKTFSPEILIDATVATDDIAKNGYKFNLNLLEHLSVFSRNLGKILGRYYYFYKINAGGYLETNQKWNARRIQLKANSIFEIPYTNILSLLVHQQYNMLRTAPGLIISISYLNVLDYTKEQTFAKNHRLDIEGYYNVTLNPITFSKLKAAAFYDPEKGVWKSYQEYQIAIKFDKQGNTHYFLKYIRGFNPPIFDKEVDEVSIGIATKF